MAEHKIVITGGPGTGKTAVINQLSQEGYQCSPEISRQIILEARESGIEHLFLSDPLLFSQKLLEGRTKQYQEATLVPGKTIFIDRGIPDIIAYMHFMQQESPNDFIEACTANRYTSVFILPPWSKIHTTDNERYESFEQTTQIHQHLKTTYENFGYTCIPVPFGTISERCDFILNNLTF